MFSRVSSNLGVDKQFTLINSLRLGDEHIRQSARVNIFYCHLCILLVVDKRTQRYVFKFVNAYYEDKISYVININARGHKVFSYCVICTITNSVIDHYSDMGRHANTFKPIYIYCGF